jgi:hypothetical protein
MYITVKLVWVLFTVGVVVLTGCAWKFPRTVVPITIGLAAATVLAAILHL